MNDSEKVLRILELLEKILGNLEKYDRTPNMQSSKHSSEVITEIKKALELLDELSVLTGQDMQLLKEIKEILEDKS